MSPRRIGSQSYLQEDLLYHGCKRRRRRYKQASSKNLQYYVDGMWYIVDSRKGYSLLGYHSGPEKGQVGAGSAKAYTEKASLY